MATNTTATTQTHNGTGGQANFAISFSFLADSEVDVTVGGVLKTLGTHYTISGSTLTFTSGNIPPSGTGNIRFVRDTNISAKKVDFQDGSVLTETDLDTNSDQILFAQQEIQDLLNNEVFTRDGLRTLTGSISFEGSNDDANETTLTVTNPTADRTITFPDITGTVITSADTGTVNSTMITNNTIVDGDINSSANINGSKLLNDSVGLTKLGGGALPTDITIASANIVNGTIVNEDIATGTLDGRYYTETELNAGQLDNRYYTETELNAGQLDTRYYTETELLNGALDGRYFTETEADARYYNLSSVEEIQSGETWTAADNKVATTAAIDARIIDLVDDVGGFVPITNETSFPNANPDINNGAGTLVSVPLANNITSNGSGVISISNGTVGNSTVTINGATASTTFTQGFGIIVETTSTLNTYTFHRYVPKATEVTTVAGSISNVNTIAGISSNVTTVAGIASSVPTVAGIASNVTTVAGVSSNVTTIAGISGNVTTVAGISSNVTTVANDGTDIGLVAGSIANVNTTAGSIDNVNTTAGSISNVNTVATNITNVNNASTYLNNFLALYLGQASSDPTQDALGASVTEGDLYFNSVSKQLRVFNGQVFQGIAENAVEVAKFATAAFNALYTASAGSNSIDLGGLAITGAVFSNEAIAANRVSLGKGSGTFNLGGI